jgi:hypothetical protein
MNTKMLKLARRLWTHPEIPKEVQRIYQRKWIRSLRTLGKNWQLATYEVKK